MEPQRYPSKKYLYSAIGLIGILIVGLAIFLWHLTKENAYSLLIKEGRHIADSISKSTSYGLRTIHSSQNQLIDHLRRQAKVLDSLISKDSKWNISFIKRFAEDEHIDRLLILDKDLKVIAAYENGEAYCPITGDRPGMGMMMRHGGMGMGRFRSYRLYQRLVQFKASSKKEMVFYPWRSFIKNTRPLGYALKRKDGGIIFLRATQDLTKKVMDIESIKRLFHDLALSSKVNYLALVNKDGLILIHSDETKIGGKWYNKFPKDHLLIKRSIKLNKNETGMLYVSLSTRELRVLLGETRRNLFIFSLIALLLGILGTYYIFVLNRRHQEEMVLIGEEMNRQQHLADLGRMAATLAHEIRNPLNAIGLAVQRLQREAPPACIEKYNSFEEFTSLIKKEIKRLNGIVEGFLSLSRLPGPNKEAIVDISRLMEDLSDLYGMEAEAKSIKLHYYTIGNKGSCYLYGDEEQLKQAIGNILHNSIEVASSNIWIFMEFNKNDVKIRIEDDGPGFSGEAIENAIKPFFTTKIKGSGLGLSISKQIIEGHDGRLTITNRKRGGARVEVYLPCKEKDV